MTYNSTQVDTLEFLAAKSSYPSMIATQTQTQMNQQQQQRHISVSSNHGDNTSFIIGTNQESKSVTAYISSPPPPITSPLATQVQMENIIMDDITCTSEGDINDSAISNGSDSNSDNDSDSDINSMVVAAKANKKKSVKSRFNVLKNSKLRLKPGNRPPTEFIFLPSSSSTPIIPLEKRHSTSTLIKSHHPHLQEKRTGKVRSSLPSCGQKANHSHDSSVRQHPPTAKTTTSVILHAEEKNKGHPSSSVTRYVSSSPSLASPTDLTETTSSPYSIDTTNDDSQSPHVADPSTSPPSRFLAAFQKIRQQKSLLDPSVSTTTNGMTRQSMDVSPVPIPSVAIGTGSKSTSFTEKIKIRFKPSSRPATMVTPPPAAATATRKATPSSPVAPQPSHSSTSIINRSWSPFSRSLASSNSMKYTPPRHHPQQLKQQQQHNQVMEGQVSSTHGKRTPSSSHHHHSNRTKLPSQQQQQRFVQHPALSSKPTSAPRGFRHSTTPKILAPLDHDKGATATFAWDYSFDANTYTIRGDTMIASTCSTSSQRSSMSSLSVTASSSTSASSSPTSLSTDLSHDSRKPLDISINNNNNNNSSSSTIPDTANKSYARSILPQSQRSPSGHRIDSVTIPIASRSLSIPNATDIVSSNKSATTASSLIKANHASSFRSPPSHLAFRSISSDVGGNGNNNNNKQINKSAAAAAAGPATTYTRLKTTTSSSSSTTNNKKKKKHHVRFVPTAKVQDTFSKHDYDRASDPYAICTQLTAQLAQQIKDELNAFKLEEMLVHHQSRGNTQFFM